MEWVYSENQDAYLAGTTRYGCGVFKDLGPDSITWSANVVYAGNIICIDNLATKEQAMEEAEKEFVRLEEKFKQ